MVEEVVRRGRGRRFRESGSDKQPAMIVRAADEDFFPRLRMSRGEVVAVGKLVEFRRRQLREDVPDEITEEGVAQPVDALEVLEQQNESLEMRGAQLAVDAVERVRNGMGNRLRLQEGLQIENILAQARNLGVLPLGKAPDKQTYLTCILRKISRNLFTDKCIIE